MRPASILLLSSFLGGCFIPNGRGGIEVPGPALEIGGAIAGAMLAAGLEGAMSHDGGEEEADNEEVELPPLQPGETRILYRDNWACLYNPECLPPNHPVCREAPDGCCPC